MDSLHASLDTEVTLKRSEIERVVPESNRPVPKSNRLSLNGADLDRILNWYIVDAKPRAVCAAARWGDTLYTWPLGNHVIDLLAYVNN